MASLFESQNKYFIRFKANGIWKQKYAGLVKRSDGKGITKAQAKLILADYQQRENNDRFNIVLKNIDITAEAALNEFQEYLLRQAEIKGLALNTKRDYKTHIKFIKNWFEKIGITKLSKLLIYHVEQFTIDMNGFSQKTKWGKQNIFLRFLEWSGELGYWNYSNQLKKIERIGKSKSMPRYLTLEQLKQVFENAPPEYENAIRFQYYTGARVGEVGNLKFSDYNSENGTLIFPVCDGMKKKKESIIYLNQKAIEIIEKQKNINGKNGAIFLNSRGKHLSGKRLGEVEKKIFNKLNIKAESHILRHTFASQLASNGANLSQIKELLRHENIETTMIYAHLIKGAQKRAVELLPIV